MSHRPLLSIETAEELLRLEIEDPGIWCSTQDELLSDLDRLMRIKHRFDNNLPPLEEDRHFVPRFLAEKGWYRREDGKYEKSAPEELVPSCEFYNFKARLAKNKNESPPVSITWI